MEKRLVGLSSRRYNAELEPAGASSGRSGCGHAESAVSGRFVAAEEGSTENAAVVTGLITGGAA